MIESSRTDIQSKINSALLLANGDVSYTINAGRTVVRPLARRITPFSYSVSPVNPLTNGGTVITSRNRSSVSVPVIHPAVSNDARFLVQRIGAPADFTFDTGMFSGMAVRSAVGDSSDAAGLYRESDRMPAILQSSANAGANGSPLPAKTAFDAGKEPVSADAPVLDDVRDGIGSNGVADPAKTGSTHGPKRNLVLSAFDRENIKTYQLGGETASEVSSGGYAVTEKGLCCNSSMTVSDCCRSAVEDYDFPCVIVDDGSGENRCGWIGVYPVMPGYSRIQPWNPGIIEIPVWPGEFEIVEDFGIELMEDWVDFEGSDISMIELEYSAKLSFIVSAADRATFTVYKSEPGADGERNLTAIQTSSLVLDRETDCYEVTTKELLLDAGEYYISIESSGNAEGGSSYFVSVNDEVTEYFTDGDNSDDWTDLNTAGADGEVGDLGILDEYSFNVLSDWVGYGDAVDYAGFTLDSAAKLSFAIDSSDALRFTVYQLIESANGSYSLKTLQTTALSYDREFEDYEAVTKGLLLSSGTYYISVQSTNADQGGSAYYNVYLDDENTEFFTEGDNSDDWTDLKTAGADGEVGDLGILDEYSFYVFSDWVGYGDAVDYPGFTLDSAAKLSFCIDASDAVKFTVYQLVESANGSYSLKTLQTTALSYDREFEDYEAVTKELLLSSGTYYISVQSTNADQGGSAYYNVYLDDENTEFFTEGDNSDDWTDLKTAGADGEVGDLGILDEHSFYVLSDWVGYGDSVDYAGFTLDSAARLSFAVDSSDAVKFTIYQLIESANGSYSLKALQTTALSYDREFEDYEAVTKELLLSSGTYYISVQSAKADQSGSAYYNIWVETYTSVFDAATEPEEDADPLAFGETCTGSVCNLSLPERDSLAMIDASNLTNVLSSCRYDVDPLAGASAVALAELDDKAGWQNFAALA